MAKDVDSEQMLQLVNTLLSLVQNISTGTRMMQQATGNFNHLATMPVNVASIYTSLLQRLGSQYLGPFGGMIGAYAGKTIFGTGYDPKTGQPTSRFMDPVGLTLTGFQYNVAAGQNQAYLNITANSMFKDEAQQKQIKLLYNSVLGISATGTRTIVDFMFDPLQKRTMAASTNAIMTSAAQSMLTDPGKILSQDERDSLDKLRDLMTTFGLNTQLGVEYNGGFNAGATLTLASAIASQDTSIKASFAAAGAAGAAGGAGGGGAGGAEKVGAAGELLKKRTRLLSDALTPLRDVFGNLMPILLAKLEQITGQGVTSMSADKLKQLSKHLHGTMAATNVGLLQLGQQQALVQQASAAMGNTILGSLAMHVAMLNVQGVTGNAGFLGSRQKFQQQVTKTTVGAANSYNANIIAGALNILTARGKKEKEIADLRKYAASGDIGKAMDILKNEGISLWLALRAAGWLADPTARRYGTLMAINAGGKDIDAAMQAAFNGYVPKSPNSTLDWNKFSNALDSGIKAGLSGQQLLKHISDKAEIGLLDAYWLTQQEPIKAGITSRAHRHNLKVQQQKLLDDIKRQERALRFLKAFVTPRAAGGLLGGMYTNDSKLRIAIYNKDGEVVGHADQELLNKDEETGKSHYTDKAGTRRELTADHYTLGADGSQVTAGEESIVKALDLKQEYVGTFSKLTGSQQRVLALMGNELRDEYLSVIHADDQGSGTDELKEAKRKAAEQKKLLLNKQALETQFGITLQEGLNATLILNRVYWRLRDPVTKKPLYTEALLKEKILTLEKKTSRNATEEKELNILKRDYLGYRVTTGQVSKELKTLLAKALRLSVAEAQRNAARTALIDALGPKDKTSYHKKSTEDLIQLAKGALKHPDTQNKETIQKHLDSLIESAEHERIVILSAKGSTPVSAENIGKLVLGVLKLLVAKLALILGRQESKGK